MSSVLRSFLREYDALVRLGFVKPEYIFKHSVASEVSFHSILQYMLVKAGIDCGYISIPEYKVRLKREPIDKFKLDERFSKVKKARYQWHVAVDVAFLRDLKLTGIGEIYTIDEIHGCVPSKELSGPWITPYHKLQSLVKNLKGTISFLIIVNAFPRTIEKKRLPWEDARKLSVNEWREKWKELTDELRKEMEVHHIEVHEDGASEIAY